jgi:hypothetical protein
MVRQVPGSGAQIKANFDANYGIASFTITNGGTGYASTNPPRIDIEGTRTPTVQGSFYPIIVNGQIASITVLSSGEGYYPNVSVAQTAVGIASIGRDGSNDVVKSIYVSNPGIGYTEIPTVTISNPDILTGVGTYYFNEIVYGSKSGTEARVKEWDQDTKILKISNVSIGSTRSGFYPGETVIGKESGARYTVQVFTNEDIYDKYTENDEFETLGDSIIDFTESNPFGTF